MSEIKRVILDIDNAHLDTQIKHIKRYVQNRDTNLIIPREYAELCGVCGQHMYKNGGKSFYYNEFFCTKCVDRMKQGY